MIANKLTKSVFPGERNPIKPHLTYKAVNAKN